MTFARCALHCGQRQPLMTPQTRQTAYLTYIKLRLSSDAYRPTVDCLHSAP